MRDFVSVSSITNPALKLSTTDSYIKRHIGNDEGECNEILKTLNVKSIDQLMDETVPSQIRISDEDLFVHNGKSFKSVDSESGVLKKMSQLAKMNKVYKSYIGQGYYPSITPSVIKRNVLENPKWYTPYTPYQAEIAQGRLEMLLNYQTMITELTALDISNSSLLDEASAAAEACSMAYATHNGKRAKLYVSNSIYPQTIDVMQTRAGMIGVELVFGEPGDFPWEEASKFCGVIVQSPDNIGNCSDFTDFFGKLKEQKVRGILIQDLLSTAIAKPAGEMNADIAVGSVQRLGIPMGLGGPHPAYIACKDEFKRKMPGRIIGVSKDVHGDTAYRMAM